jgi:hypothetical protein
MDFLRKARDLEAKLAGTLDRTVGGLVRSGAREPLEIVHAIVDAAQAEIQSSGRGRRVFPFNTVTVTILAPSRDARARFEGVLADGPSLRDRLLARLAGAACHVESDLDVDITFESRARKTWRNPEFHLAFDRVDRPEPAKAEPQAAPPRLELTIVHGTAERRSYSLAPSTRIDLGRCAEVRDDRHRLIRTNHIAFLEQPDDVNRSVSRRHAHISHEPATHSLRLHDDGSEHGTGIVRSGRTLPVPRGARGVRLESGDEIVLGEARVRVKLGDDAKR